MTIENLDPAILSNRRGEKWSHYSEDVLPAWVADMDFPIAEPIQQAIRHRIDVSDCGYPVAAVSAPPVNGWCRDDLFGWSKRG